MAKRGEIIEVGDRNPFGEDIDASVMESAQRDIFYIPGYSDVRHARELAIRNGESPPPMPFRLQWVRAENTQGVDRRKISEWKSKGYQVLSWEQAAELGLDIPSTPADKGPGGEVRNGDQVLMYAPKAVAAANYARWQQDTQGQHDALVTRPLQDAADAANTRMGLSEGRGTAFSFEVEEPAPKRGPGRPRGSKNK